MPEKKEVAAETKKSTRKDRSFKAIYEDPSGEVVTEGRYSGFKPKQASSKALTAIYKLFEKSGKTLGGSIRFGLKETTRGSKNKKYWYSGEKTKITDPVLLYLLPSEDKKLMSELSKIEAEHAREKRAADKEKIEDDIKSVKKELKSVDKKSDKHTKLSAKLERLEKKLSNLDNPKKSEEGGSRKKKDSEQKKIYRSAAIIEELGGFKKVLGKKQDDVKPAIKYCYNNVVKKVSKSECEHLMDSKEVESDEEDGSQKNTKKSAKKGAKNKKTKEPKGKQSKTKDTTSKDGNTKNKKSADEKPKPKPKPRGKKAENSK